MTMKTNVEKSHIKIPWLPQGEVSHVVIDCRTPEEVKCSLEAAGITLVQMHRHASLYTAVAAHPDMQLHHLGGQDFVYAPGCSTETLNAMKELGMNLIRGETALSSAYPSNIAYNVARVGRFALHHTHYTDPVLMHELEKRSVTMIHVPQGYSKCAVAVMDETTIVTSDMGIARAVESFSLDVILIPPGGITLPGLDYGFIGGCCGMIGPRKMAVCGNIFADVRFMPMIDAAKERKIEIISLSNHIPVDVGSLIPVKCK